MPGNISCPHCGCVLQIPLDYEGRQLKCPKCQNVLQVTEDGTTNNYFLVENKVSTDFHPNICTTDGEKATVTGTVEEKDGKKMLTATSIEAAK